MLIDPLCWFEQPDAILISPEEPQLLAVDTAALPVAEFPPPLTSANTPPAPCVPSPDFNAKLPSMECIVMSPA
jgi:hypothetical protein